MPRPDAATARGPPPGRSGLGESPGSYGHPHEARLLEAVAAATCARSGRAPRSTLIGQALDQSPGECGPGRSNGSRGTFRPRAGAAGGAAPDAQSPGSHGHPHEARMLE